MKKIGYGRQTITEQDVQSVVDTLNSPLITQGPHLPEFEQQVADYHGAKYAVAFCNGTAALHACYAVLELEEGSEFITTPLTFAASANGGLYCGLKPQFADIDETSGIDPDDIERRITPKTKVITPVSYAGYPADLKRIREIADANGCYIIHDAAHAIGSKRGGTFGMEYADMAILSFHPVKHVTTGEGGMVLTNSKELYHKLQLFRSHGITKDPDALEVQEGPWYYEMQSLGYNYRMTDFQAALGIQQFSRIEQNLKDRNALAKRYDEAFKDHPYFLTAPSFGYEILEQDDPANVHSYHLYTLRTKDPAYRKHAFNYMHEHGIMSQVHYVPVHRHPYYRDNFGFKKGDFPKAEAFYEAEISIPMFHNMLEDEQAYVIETLLKYRPE